MKNSFIHLNQLTLFLQRAHMASFSKTFDFNFRRDHQKNFILSVATLSKQTKRAYLRLYMSRKITKKRIQEVKG